MQLKTEQHMISYGIGMTGVVVICAVANPNDVLQIIILILGICLFGFGAVLEGSIKE